MRARETCASIWTLFWIAGFVAEASEDPSVNFRGVDPADLSLYQGKEFRCKDESRILPIERFNDDYCDCVDGSDEPGTNACLHGRFYCKNVGHEPKLLYSSFVDDGICDCCDGTDEWSGKVTCENVCWKLGEAKREAAKEAVGIAKSGFVIRISYIREAKSTIEGWKAELAVKKQEVLPVSNELETLERLIADVERQVEERAREERVPEEIEPSGTANESPELQEQDLESSEPIVKEEADHQDTQGLEGEGDRPLSTEEELDAEELGRRVASRWTTDEAAAGSTHEDYDDEDDEDEEDYDEEEYDTDEEIYSEEGTSTTDEEGDVPNRAFHPSTKGTFWKTFTGILGSKPWKKMHSLLFWRNQAEVELHEEDLEDLKRKKNDLLARKKSLEERIDDLTTWLNTDYGSEGEFLPLRDKCFEASVDKYTYEVCPFKKAKQKEGAGVTQLGKWSGFGDNYGAMVFSNGQNCWQGPNRSLRIRLTCNKKEKLGKIEEPSRCEYQGELETPAACSASHLTSVLQFYEDAMGPSRDTNIHEEL